MKKVVFLMLLFVCNVQAQFTDDINSNRPGKSFGAFSVGKSVLQIETGANYVKEDHSNLNYNVKGYNADLNFRWGIFKEELEFIGELNYQNDSGYQFGLPLERSGCRQATFGAKYLFYDPFKNRIEKPNLYSWKANQRFKWNQLIPAVAGYVGVNLNFSDINKFNNSFIVEPPTSYKATIIAQNHFGTRWVLVTNLTYNKITSPFASLDYILTLTRGFNDKWSAFVENQGYNSKYYSDGVFRAGAAYLLKRSLQLDASIGYNIKTTPQIFNLGLGLSWRYTKNYREVKMKAPDKQSKMDKKMDKAAEKEQKKKRKDQIGQ